MSTTARFECPSCHARYRDTRAASWVGRKVRCNKCSHVFVLERVEVSENTAVCCPGASCGSYRCSHASCGPRHCQQSSPCRQEGPQTGGVVRRAGLVFAVVCGVVSVSVVLMWPLIFVAVGLIATGGMVLGLAVLGLPVWIIEKIQARSAGGSAGASGSNLAASRPPSTLMGRAKQAYAAILVVGLCVSGLTGLCSRQKPYEAANTKVRPVPVPSQQQTKVQSQSPQVSPEDALRALLLLNAAAQQQQQRPVPQQGYRPSYGYFPQGTTSQTPAPPAAPAWTVMLGLQWPRLWPILLRHVQRYRAQSRWRLYLQFVLGPWVPDLHRVWRNRIRELLSSSGGGDGCGRCCSTVRHLWSQAPERSSRGLGRGL